MMNRYMLEEWILETGKMDECGNRVMILLDGGDVMGCSFSIGIRGLMGFH